MGKYLKTEIDWQMINEFAKEILRMEFDNPVLKKWCDTEGYEGSELRKYLTENCNVKFHQEEYGSYVMFPMHPKRKD